MATPVTLVTGASSGLGAEFARACAKAGDTVVLTARRRERMEALAAELGPDVHVLPSDLARPEAPAELVAELESRGLEVAILINNAGFGLAGRFAEAPLGRQREMIRLNVEALVTLTHLVLPGMIARKDGAILNVASTAAFQAGPGLSVYFATKAFVLSFTEALHEELRNSGVRVSALCPGPTATEFQAIAGTSSRALQGLSAHAADVVEAGLSGLASNKAIVIPGLVNRAGAQSNRILPRALIRRIVASLKM